MYCKICFDEQELISGQNCTQSICGCCNECLGSYLQEKIHDFSFETGQKINCPYFKCNNSYSCEEWLSLLHGESQTKVTDTLLSTYKRNSSDIYECNKCGWFGYADSNALAQWKCEECGICHQISNKSQSSFLAILFRSIWQGEIINELFSQTYKALLTDSCPCCKISILKNRGCPHMICKKCNYEFCWWCKQPHLTHNSDLCIAQMLMKMFLIGYLLLMILTLFSYHIIIINTLTFLFFFILKYVIFYNGFILLIILLFIQAQDEYRLRNSQQLHMNSILPFIILNSSVIFIIFLIIYCNGLINELFKTIINEIILITIAGTATKAGQFVWDNWLVFVK